MPIPIPFWVAAARTGSTTRPRIAGSSTVLALFDGHLMPVAGLSSIEDATGSHYDDTILGDNGDNTLDGGFGNDTIDGGGGINTAAPAQIY